VRIALSNLKKVKQLSVNKTWRISSFQSVVSTVYLFTIEVHHTIVTCRLRVDLYYLLI
jgi:hypothetical protein